MRLLLLLLLLMIVYWWARKALQAPRRGGGKGKSARGESRKEAERMLACDHCGIHIPESEGVREGGDFFCCEAHRRLGVKR